MTIKEVTEDLKEIKYFYQRQDALDISNKSFNHVKGIEKVRKYKQAISNAKIQLFDVYVVSCIDGLTADAAAEEIGVSYQTYNRRLNEMKRYFIDYFDKNNIEDVA